MQFAKWTDVILQMNWRKAIQTWMNYVRTLILHYTIIMPYFVVPSGVQQQLTSGPVIDAVCDLAADWMLFGAYLEIPSSKLQTLENCTTCEKCMYKTLNEWVTLKVKEATIENLIAAVRSRIVDNESLAQTIENDPNIREWFKGT